MHPVIQPNMNMSQLTVASVYSTAVNTEAINASIVRTGQVAHRDAMLQLAALAAIGIGIRRLNLKVDTLNENVEGLRVTAVSLLASSHRTNEHLADVVTSLQNIDSTLKSPSETRAKELAINGIDALKSGWIDDAIKDLNSSIELYKYDPFSHAMLASALVHADQHAVAKIEYGLAIKYALSSNAAWGELPRACEWALALASLEPVALESENYLAMKKLYEALLEAPDRLNEHLQPIQIVETLRAGTLKSLIPEPDSEASSVLAFLLYWAISNTDSELASKLLIINSDLWVDLANSEETEFVRKSLQLSIERCFSIYVDNLRAAVEGSVAAYANRDLWRFQPLDYTQLEEKCEVDQSIVNRAISEMAEDARTNCLEITELLDRIREKPNSVSDCVYFIQTTKEALEIALELTWSLPTRSKAQSFGNYRKSRFQNEPLQGQMILRTSIRLQPRALSLGLPNRLF